MIMMKWLSGFFGWLGRVFKRDGRLRTVRVEELPLNPSPKEVYVLGEGENFWFVALLCPCGCRGILQMSLLPGANPRWHLIQHDDDSISLEPSVWRKVGCRSHFFIRRGKIIWCGK